MNKRKALVGLCMLCALLTSAFAAQSASAITGTTAFTCVKVTAGTGVFSEAHCKAEGGGKEYEHEVIAENTTTELAGNDNGGGTKLKATIGGISMTLTSTSLSMTGSMENLVDAGGANNKEHYASGTGTIEYKGVTVNVPKCFVYKDAAGKAGTKEAVTTNLLAATTTGQGMGVKITPAAGGPFATFMLDDATPEVAPHECPVALTYEVTGSVVGTPEGATIVFIHGTATTGTTGQNTLRLGPPGSPAKAGYEGSLTLEGRDPTLSECTYTPLAATTVTT